MSYRVKLKKKAQKELDRLDAKSKLLVLKWIKENLENCDNPRAVAGGKTVEGVENGWRWRVGSYRILAVIEDEEITILVFRVGHR